MKKLIEYLFISSFIFTFFIASGLSVLTGPGGGIIDPQSENIIQSESHILVYALAHPGGGIIDPQSESIQIEIKS